MLERGRLLLLILALACSIAPVQAGTAPLEITDITVDKRIELTEAERDWIAAQPDLEIGVMDAWPPLDFAGPDGSGYPRGLSGDEIPVSGRLMALADVYDALISRRVYKPPFSHTKAVGIILEGRGSHFDPRVVDAFMALQEDFRGIVLADADHEEERRNLMEPYRP